MADEWMDRCSKQKRVNKTSNTERYNIFIVYPVCVCECPGVGDDVLVGEHQVHQHHLAVEDTPHLPHLLLLLHLLARGGHYHWLG